MIEFYRYSRNSGDYVDEYRDQGFIRVVGSSDYEKIGEIKCTLSRYLLRVHLEINFTH